MVSNRRGFLGLIGSVVAAPQTAAKTAAQAMGLSAPTGLLAAQIVKEGATPGMSSGPHEWAVEQIGLFWTDRHKRNRKAEVAMRSKLLDPDLASMRSISPSAAYSIQMSRTQKRVDDERWENLIWSRDNNKW